MSFARPPTQSTAAAPPPQSTSPAVPEGSRPGTTQQLQPASQIVNGQVLTQQPQPQASQASQPAVSHVPPQLQGLQHAPAYANGMPAVLPGSLQPDPSARGSVVPQPQHPQALHPQGSQSVGQVGAQGAQDHAQALHQPPLQHPQAQSHSVAGQTPSVSGPGPAPGYGPGATNPAASQPMFSQPGMVAAAPIPGQVTPRLAELLDSVKQEFMQVSAEASRAMLQKDDVDTKLIQQHMSELTQVRKTIYELDQAHRQMRERYEDELQRLRKKLDQSNPRPPPVFSVRFHKEAPSANGDAAESTQGLPLPIPRQAGADGEKRSSSNAAARDQPSSTSAGEHSPGNDQQSTASPPLSANATSASDAPKSSGSNGAASTAPAVGAATTTIATPVIPPIQSNSASAAPPTSAEPAPDAAAAAEPTESENATAPKDVKDPRDPKEAAQEARDANRDVELPDAVSADETGEAKAPESSAPKATESAEDSSSSAGGLATLEFDSVPAEYKKDAGDFRVIYNKDTPARADVELVNSLQHGSVVCCVRFNSDGTLLATGCNRSAQIYDVETGELKARLEDPTVDSTDLYIRSVCFSPDSRYLATGTEDHKVRVWDIEKREIRFVFEGHEQDIYSLSYSHNGKFIASGSGDRHVRLWDVESGECIRTFEIEDGVTAIAISRDDRYVAAGSLDRTVRVCDVEKGEQVERLARDEPHEDSVYSVAFRPGTNEVVSGSLDKTVKVWSFKPGQPNEGHIRLTVRGHEDYVLSVCVTHEGAWVLSGSKDRTVQMWDANTGEAQLLLQAHNNSVISVAPSPQQDMFASGSGDFTAKIWRYKPRT